jgi:hypothetical protein
MSHDATVPVTMTSQHSFSWEMCHCGAIFKGRGLEGITAAAKALEAHQDTCTAQVDEESAWNTFIRSLVTL